MNLTFSFDLGSNSIGYSVIDPEKKKILHAGANVFTMGVNLEKGTREVSKNAKRREKRQIRRQNFRRRMRKEILARELTKHSMFPDIEKLHEKYFGKSNKRYREQWEEVVRAIPLCEELAAFFAMDPYQLRHKAFEGGKLSRLELGRVFYQMAQRRGYRETLQDDDDDKGVLYSGKPEEEKTGIDETREGVQKFGTLGNYLYNLDPIDTRIRNRYTLRSMYEQEFDAIWNEQQEHYPELLTDQLYQRLGGRHKSMSRSNGIVFHYRPLRSMRHLLGKCNFEPTKKVTPISRLEFERFRALQFVNNIKYEKRPLEESERLLIQEMVLNATKKFDFSKISKKLKKDPKLFNYEEKDKVIGSPTTANLKKVFGKNWENITVDEKNEIWHHKHFEKDAEHLEDILTSKYNLNDEQIEKFKKFRLAKGYANLSRKAIIGILHFLELGYIYDRSVLLAGVRNAMGKEQYDSMSDFEQSELESQIIEVAETKSEGTSLDRVRQWLLDHKALSDKQLNKLYHHSIKKTGNSELKELPEPENIKNPIVMQALFELRKVYNALVKEFGEPATVKIELARDLKSNKKTRDKIRNQQRDRETQNDEIKEILDKHNQPHSAENIQKLKLYYEIQKRFGTCINPYNPEKSIGIEELLRPDGFIQIEHIVPYSISLNDSLANKTLCDADTNRAKGNKTPYEYFKDNPERWEAIKNIAFKLLPYQKAKRFVSTAEYEADDFISRQLNDTRYISKVAVEYLKTCCEDVQVTQGTLTSMLRYYWGLDAILSTSYEIEAEDGEYFLAVDKFDMPIEWRKWNKKTKKKDQTDLKKRGELLHGTVRNGKFNPLKPRDDHRHHALDAIVVGCAKRQHLESVSRKLGDGLEKGDLKYNRDHQIEKPWDGFWNDVRRSIDNILIHHTAHDRVVTKIKKHLYDEKGNMRKTPAGEPMMAQGLAARGQLHEETVFGKHENNKGEIFYHVRKPVDFVQNNKHLASIVDKRVRRAILERLMKLYPSEKLEDGKLPAKWSLKDLSEKDRLSFFFKSNDGAIPTPMIYLESGKGQKFPVKKVRTKERATDLPQLKSGVNQYVKPGNNHHFLVYETEEGMLDWELANFWTVVERRKQNLPIFKLPENGKQILNAFVKNELYVLDLSNERFNQLLKDKEYYQLGQHLFRVQKMTHSGYLVEFRKHTASQTDNPNDWKAFSSMNGYKELNPIAVTVSEIGMIRPKTLN